MLLYTLLLFILGLINPWVPDLKSNVCPDNIIAGIYPVDIFEVDFPDLRNFNVKQELPGNPLTNKPDANKAKSPSPADQCYLYEGHRSFADRGPDPALLAFSGIFSGYPYISIAVISRIPFGNYSSWTGNCEKIRPPPVC